MPLPTPMPLTFPQPMPLSFPQPMYPPTFGLTADDQMLQAVNPAVAGTPTPWAPPAAGVVGYQNGLSAMSAWTNGAVGPGNDPRAWTPEEAAAQTDRALARIGQANPALAQSIAEEQGRQVEQGGGFFDAVMGGIGKFFDVSGLDTVFEVISRPAQILPEIVMDWGKESVWKNMGDALTGNSDVSWDDVLVEKMGMERNWFTATLGFIGDVALDPLTWASFGTAGIGRSILAKTGAKVGIGAAFTESATITSRIASEGLEKVVKELGEDVVMKNLDRAELFQVAMNQGARTVEEAAGAVLKVPSVAEAAAARASTGFWGKATSALSPVHTDALPGVLNTLSSEGAQRALREMTSLADDAATLAYRGKWGQGSAKLMKAFDINKSSADDMLKGFVSRGTGFRPGFGKEARKLKGFYQEARAAQALRGGWSMRLNIPVLGLRLAPRRLMPAVTTRLDFSIGRRFFAGMAGEMRLEKMVGKGAASAEHLRAFWEGGFDLLQRVPGGRAVAKEMSGGAFGAIGSPLMSLSEQVGRLTGALSPHAKAMRTNTLAGIMAAESKKLSTHMKASLTEDIFHVEDSTGRMFNSKTFEQEFGRVFRSGKLDEAQEQVLASKLDSWLRLFPEEVGYGSTDDMLKGFRTSLDGVAEKTAEARELESWFRSEFGDESFEYIQLMRKVANKGRAMRTNYGLSPDLDEFPWQDVDDMSVEDAKRIVTHEGSSRFHGKRYSVIDDAVDMDKETFGDHLLTEAEHGGVAFRGFHLQAAGDLEVGAEAAARNADLVTAQAAVRDAENALLGQKTGVVVGSPDELIAAKKAALGDLVTARQQVTALTARNREVVVYARNPLIRDLTGDAAGDVAAGYPTDVAKEMADGYRPVLEAIEGKARILAEGADPRVKAAAAELVERQDTVGTVVSRLIQEQGYDSVITRVRNEAGEVEEFVTLFKNADRSFSAARLTEGAPRLALQKGQGARWATENALKAVNRSKVSEAYPGGSRVWLERQIRDVSRLSYEEAETELRRRMAAEGVALLPGEQVLIRDPLHALKQHVAKDVSAVHAKLQGQAFRTLETLGLGKSVFNGNAVGLNRYRWVVNEELLDNIEKLGEDVAAASKHATVMQMKAMKELEGLARQAVDDIAGGYETLRNAMNVLDEKDMRRVLGLSEDSARQVADFERPDHQMRRSLNDAVKAGKADELEDGIWRWVDESGDVYYASTKLDEGAPGTAAIPAGSKRYFHEGWADRLDSYKEKGVLATPDRFGDVARNTVYAADETAGGAARVLDGALDDDRVLIEFWGDPSQARKGGPSGGVTFYETVPPERIVAIHKGGQPPGRHISAVRTVKASGEVSSIGTDQKSLASLVRRHWTDEGVYSSEDQIRSASEVLERNGLGRADDIEQRLLSAQDRDVRMFEGENLEKTEAINEVNRLATRLQTEAAQVKPALLAADENVLNAEGFERLDIPGFETLAMPSFMAAEFREAVRGFRGVEGIHAEFRKFNAWWKSHATWMWPGFHVRNLYGAFFNNTLGGVDISDYILAGRTRFAARELADGKPGKWAGMRIADKDGDLIEALRRNGTFSMNGKRIEDMTYGDLSAMTVSQGVTAGNSRAFAEARPLGTQEAEQSKKMLLEKIPGGTTYTKGARGAGTLTENVMRTAAFSRGLRTYGSVIDARAFTMMRHGDYADLTDFEAGAVRDLIPFYKWMRTNVPFQVHQMLETPGALLAVKKAQGAAFTAAGLDYDEERYRMPSWMGEQFTIPFGARTENGETVYDTVMLDLPMSDLHIGAREFVSSFLPAIRPLLENYVYEQSTFTGAPITGEKVPLAGVFNVPGIRDVLDVVGMAEKGADGQLYTTDKNQNLLGVVPAFSRFRSWLYADPDRVKTRMTSLASAAFGFTMRPVDQDALNSAELDFYYSQVLPALTHLRQMGYPLPTTDDIQDTVGTIDTALMRLGIEPRTTSSTSLV